MCEDGGLESLLVTLFCIRGNHEQGMQTIDSYRKKQWYGGTVYYEAKYPDLLLRRIGKGLVLMGSRPVCWAELTALTR